MADDLHATVAQRLHDDGQRYTRQRRALVELLAEVAPLSIPELLEHAPELAQSSAYRNLAVLERAGIVHRIVTSHDFARYELAEDLTHHHHHHLICTSCGAVADFEMAEAVEQELEAALARAARRAGYRVRAHRLDLVGTCPACA
jgi:Fur family ferric uptake transcriptional regulator